MFDDEKNVITLSISQFTGMLLPQRQKRVDTDLVSSYTAPL